MPGPLLFEYVTGQCKGDSISLQGTKNFFLQPICCACVRLSAVLLKCFGWTQWASRWHSTPVDPLAVYQVEDESEIRSQLLIWDQLWIWGHVETTTANRLQACFSAFRHDSVCQWRRCSHVTQFLPSANSTYFLNCRHWSAYFPHQRLNKLSEEILNIITQSETDKFAGMFVAQCLHAGRAASLLKILLGDPT